jgi:UDP-N-acetylglucosamine--N-acetylmuramyl-(pentapeptide) pyrophosphoryl-undecaprenol N-acetylglucosamine transferase
MRAVIVAGGTGGHFYPGLAVAQEWISKKNDVVFFVRKSDFVLPSLQKEKISYEEISAAGFSRKLNFQLFTAFFKLMGGFWQSIIKLRRIKPHLVFVMGGYLSVPVALAAWFLRIPIVLHEQNAIPGLANRLVSKFASKIALSFDTSKTYFSGSVQVTGNPVRQEFYDLPDKSAALEKFNLKNDRFTILVFGGSQGAKRINDLFIKVLLELKNLKDSMQFILISGPKEENEAKSQLKNSPFHYYLAGYCHDMRSAYAASDFVICRSGASTVSELLAVQKPALLILLQPP